MNKEKKVNKVKNKKVIKIAVICIGAVLVIALIAALIYYGSKAYKDYKEKKSYNDLANLMSEASNEPEPEKEKTERMIKLEELHNQYPGVVAWIELPDTNINYPVVQGEDNDYYLTHTYKGEYSARGSIFLDKDASITKPSDNFLIYGHRNKNRAMFEDMLKYESEDFYKGHKEINFTTLEEDAKYEILAVFRARILKKSEKTGFRYYYFVNAKDEAEYNDFVSQAKSISLYDTGVDAKYGDQLITLSTCAYHTEKGRFAIVAKKKV